jgi:hypothetical protein
LRDYCPDGAESSDLSGQAPSCPSLATQDGTHPETGLTLPQTLFGFLESLDRAVEVLASISANQSVLFTSEIQQQCPWATIANAEAASCVTVRLRGHEHLGVGHSLHSLHHVVKPHQEACTVSQPEESGREKVQPSHSTASTSRADCACIVCMMQTTTSCIHMPSCTRLTRRSLARWPVMQGHKATSLATPSTSPGATTTAQEVQQRYFGVNCNACMHASMYAALVQDSTEPDAPLSHSELWSMTGGVSHVVGVVLATSAVWLAVLASGCASGWLRTGARGGAHACAPRDNYIAAMYHSDLHQAGGVPQPPQLAAQSASRPLLLEDTPLAEPAQIRCEAATATQALSKAVARSPALC